MFEAKVDRAIAEQEVSEWLDYKKVKPASRESNKQFVDVLIDSVMYGNVTIDAETKVITQTLDFPLKNKDGVETLTTLTYKSRSDAGALQKKAEGAKGMGIYTAYGSELTGQITATLNRLDSEDFKILQAITIFFV